MSEDINQEVITAASEGENADASAAPSPAYFLSLSVENARCFKQKQTLDLSNGHGRPAQWTLILGDNGVGKTTLLQLIALMQPEPVLHVGPMSRELLQRVYHLPRLCQDNPELNTLRDSFLSVSNHQSAR